MRCFTKNVAHDTLADVIFPLDCATKPGWLLRSWYIDVPDPVWSYVFLRILRLFWDVTVFLQYVLCALPNIHAAQMEIMYLSTNCIILIDIIPSLIRITIFFFWRWFNILCQLRYSFWGAVRGLTLQKIAFLFINIFGLLVQLFWGVWDVWNAWSDDRDNLTISDLKLTTILAFNNISNNSIHCLIALDFNLFLIFISHKHNVLTNIKIIIFVSSGLLWKMMCFNNYTLPCFLMCHFSFFILVIWYIVRNSRNIKHKINILWNTIGWTGIHDITVSTVSRVIDICPELIIISLIIFNPLLMGTSGKLLTEFLKVLYAF